MQFSERLIKFDTLLREVIRESLEQDLFQQKDIALHSGVQGRTLREYYDVGSKKSLSINVLGKLFDYISAFNFSDLIQDINDPLYTKVEELAECCAAPIGEGHFDLQPLLLSPNSAGDPNDLRQLEGIFYVMRRVLNGKAVMVSLIEITYDEDKNIGNWTNTHRGPKGPTIVKGVVTQSHGIFHFTGFISEHSTLQAMSVPKGSGWDEFSGIVLTQSKFSPICSRVVLRRTALLSEDALGKCGEVLMQGALDLGLSDALLLNNNCAEDGVLVPEPDF